MLALMRMLPAVVTLLLALPALATTVDLEDRGVSATGGDIALVLSSFVSSPTLVGLSGGTIRTTWIGSSGRISGGSSLRIEGSGQLETQGILELENPGRRELIQPIDEALLSYNRTLIVDWALVDEELAGVLLRSEGLTAVPRGEGLTAIPEPGAAQLLTLGVVALASRRRLRGQRPQAVAPQVEIDDSRIGFVA